METGRCTSGKRKTFSWQRDVLLNGLALLVKFSQVIKAIDQAL
jgi:hypothetical protein